MRAAVEVRSWVDAAEAGVGLRMRVIRRARRDVSITATRCGPVALEVGARSVL